MILKDMGWRLLDCGCQWVSILNIEKSHNLMEDVVGYGGHGIEEGPGRAYVDKAHLKVCGSSS